jgi:hypothetical protein
MNVLQPFSFGAIARRYEARHPEHASALRDGERMEFFWRFCWWAKEHGIISKTTDSAFRTFQWNPLFWRGPYWRAIGNHGGLTRKQLRGIGRADFRKSCRLTWWLISGRGLP